MLRIVSLAIGIPHADYLTASAAVMCPNSFWVEVACRTDVAVLMIIVAILVV
jgi:hypothetical protein